ncbi:MAG: response regulator [Oscillospiraceae bacterium]|nr:response regulator [Oscillospiraceae bacterium]
MKTILIIEPSDPFRTGLETDLQKDCRVYSCADAETGMQLLQECRPDGLFINLRLQGMDGLYFLEHMDAHHPTVIITLAAAYSPCIEQRLLDLGVAYPLMTGCSVRTAAHHMRRLLEREDSRILPSKQDTVSTHLRILGVPRNGGFDDLRVGTPIFAQDPGMSMTKEFYPAVAELRGRDNWQQVEKAIRSAKEAAYKNRNDVVWKEYFSDTSECPKNRDFIARLAEFVS